MFLNILFHLLMLVTDNDRAVLSKLCLSCCCLLYTQPLLLPFSSYTLLFMSLYVPLLHPQHTSHIHISPFVHFHPPPQPVLCPWLQETHLSCKSYPDTFWMCLWTWWGQSQWCMAVIPLLQHDMAVSCHGRQDDLYSAALLMAWYKWC